MIIALVKRGIARTLSLIGSVLIGLSVLLYAVLELLVHLEQARTPGERNLGVAVLFMTFEIPIGICAAAGVFCLIVGALAFAYRGFFPGISN